MDAGVAGKVSSKRVGELDDEAVEGAVLDNGAVRLQALAFLLREQRRRGVVDVPAATTT